MIEYEICPTFMILITNGFLAGIFKLNQNAEWRKPYCKIKPIKMFDKFRTEPNLILAD